MKRWKAKLGGKLAELVLDLEDELNVATAGELEEEP